MIVCNQCGVELDDDMTVCPLCENSVKVDQQFGEGDPADQGQKPALLKRILWQIACILLLSGIIAMLSVNLSVVGRVTWSIYPVTICLIAFCYGSLIALWRTKLWVQLLTGCIVSSALLGGLGMVTHARWPTSLALPILGAINIVFLLLVLIFSRLKVKGLNVLAAVFVAVAVVCLLVEAILSVYFENIIKLSWSVVVAACMLPVTAAIVFMHLRTRNNKDLQRIFHT